MTDPVLVEAARQCGIETTWYDIWGELHEVSDASLRQLLGAMGYDAESERRMADQLAAEKDRREARHLPPVIVVTVPAGDTEAPGGPHDVGWNEGGNGRAAVRGWRLVLEDGGSRSGRADGGEVLRLPGDLPTGYHELTLELEAGGVEHSWLIVAPDVCYTPRFLAGDARVWGPAVQLYALRSRRNWGVGDFSDLAHLAEIAGTGGASFVGISPLHALFPDEPRRASPYAPSNRLFLNVLLIDVEAVPEFDALAAELTGDEGWARQLERARDGDIVDYAAVAGLKWPAFHRLHHVFRKRHLEGGPTTRGREFLEYVASAGRRLREHAIFEAISYTLRARDPHCWGPPRWPRELQVHDGPGVGRFAEENGEQVEFFAWLQWEADRQLSLARARGREAGLGLGLYTDLALGAATHGSEVWADPDCYATGASIGAPPDDFNLKGQDWGLPPPIPGAMGREGYAAFAASLRATMRHAGAIRIDHVMRLLRLFWVPEGNAPADGAYVFYPMRDLLAVVALESWRHRCLVIGEDLGTVPGEVREALAAADVLSYRVFYFERTGDGSYRPPDEYPPSALATVSNHDLPTVAGYWQGRDLDAREELGLFPTETWPHEQREQRKLDCRRMLEAFTREGLLSPNEAGQDRNPGCEDPGDAPPVPVDALTRAAHRYVARTPSKLVTVQLEDVAGDLNQVNLPGTSEEQHPNWRRRPSLALEDLTGDPRWRQLVADLVPRFRRGFE